MELPAATRAAVAQVVEHPAVAWLEQLLPGLTTRRARRGAGAAVVALGQAREMLPADPAAAVAKLAPHERTLQPLAEGRELLQEARAQAALLAAATARTHVAEAAAHLEAGELERALAALEAVSVPALPPPEQQRCQELAGELEHRRALARLEGDVDRHAAAGRYLETREALDDLLCRLPEGELPPWQARRRVLTVALHRQWCLWRQEPGAPYEPRLGLDLLEEQDRERSVPLLTDGGDGLVLLSAQDRMVLLRIVGVRTRHGPAARPPVSAGAHPHRGLRGAA